MVLLSTNSLISAGQSEGGSILYSKPVRCDECLQIGLVVSSLSLPHPGHVMLVNNRSLFGVSNTSIKVSLRIQKENKDDDSRCLTSLLVAAPRASMDLPPKTT